MKEFIPGATTAQRSRNAVLVYIAFYVLLAGALWLGGQAVDTGSSIESPSAPAATDP